MRFSATLALCAAPLALAGSLQVDLLKRGEVGVQVSSSENSVSQKASNSNDNKGGNSNSNSGNNVQISQSSTSITEVIVIWVNNGGTAATSTVNSAQAVASAAATHTVVVGGAAGLVYAPNSIVAAVGDMVIFTFMSANHTATQSAFTTPCEKLVGGMDSGFMPNANNSVQPAPQMAMQVTVATPIWFYCRQSGHCGKGMTFSINPTANKTQAMFEQMAIAQNGTGTAGAITGGTAASVAAPPPPAATAAAAPAVASSASAGTMVAGTGSTGSGGACSCSCLCGVAAFPNAAVQGVGAFGGMAGAMPLAALPA